MPADAADSAAEKVVVNLLRKSGKKPEHFNEWTGIAAVGGEEVDGGNNERGEIDGRGTFNNIWTAEFGLCSVTLRAFTNKGTKV